MAATVLTRAAVDRGSRDNVTVVIVDLSPATEEELAAAEKGSSEVSKCSRAAFVSDGYPPHQPARGLASTSQFAAQK